MCEPSGFISLHALLKEAGATGTSLGLGLPPGTTAGFEAWLRG